MSEETIDSFIDPNRNCWAKFDPVVGYTLDNHMPRDGIEGCSTISTAQPSGVRTPHNYADRPCRINTYGNSFTQCHQVSDGETWQEYLAAHLEMDLDSGALVEKENLLSTPESLYRMTEPEFMVDALKDDLILQLYVARSVDPSTLDLNGLKSLAEILGVEELYTSSSENLVQSCRRLANIYGFAATKFIVE